MLVIVTVINHRWGQLALYSVNSYTNKGCNEKSDNCVINYLSSVKKTYMINYLNFLRESNIRRVYPDDKWVFGNWRVCLSGSEKEFAVVNLSSYLLASAAVFTGKYRMRELRYTGRNSSDIWASRSSRIGHIYSFDVSRDFSQRIRFLLLTVARGRSTGLKMPVILRALFIPALYLTNAGFITGFRFPWEIPIYVCRSINFTPILTFFLPFVPFRSKP